MLGARAASALDLARLGEAPIAIIVRASAASLRKIRGIYAGEVEQSFAGDYPRLRHTPVLAVAQCDLAHRRPA